MKKRILSIFTAAAMVFCLAGCQKGVDSEQSEHTSSENQQITTTAKAVEIKTIEPPKDGWTLNDLLDVTYIYGNTISSPCNLGDILNLNAFSYNDENCSINDEENTATLILEYNNESIGSIVLQNCSSIDDISNQSIVIRMFLSDFMNEKNEDNIFINGLLINDSYDSIIEKLGTPDKTESNLLTYCDKNTGAEMILISVSDEKMLGVLMFVE